MDKNTKQRTFRGNLYKLTKGYFLETFFVLYFCSFEASFTLLFYSLTYSFLQQLIVFSDANVSLGSSAPSGEYLAIAQRHIQGVTSNCSLSVSRYRNRDKLRPYDEPHGS